MVVCECFFQEVMEGGLAGAPRMPPVGLQEPGLQHQDLMLYFLRLLYFMSFSLHIQGLLI